LEGRVHTQELANAREPWAKLDPQNRTIHAHARPARSSFRNYTEKQIPDNDLNTIMEAGLYAPNGGGDIENDICFTIVQNKNVLNKLNSLAKESAKQTDMEWLKELGNNKDFNCLYNAPTLIIISYYSIPRAFFCFFTYTSCAVTIFEKRCSNTAFSVMLIPGEWRILSSRFLCPVQAK
jgi:nitroreductase